VVSESWLWGVFPKGYTLEHTISNIIVTNIFCIYYKTLLGKKEDLTTPLFYL